MNSGKHPVASMTFMESTGKSAPVTEKQRLDCSAPDPMEQTADGQGSQFFGQPTILRSPCHAVSSTALEPRTPQPSRRAIFSHTEIKGPAAAPAGFHFIIKPSTHERSWIDSGAFRGYDLDP